MTLIYIGIILFALAMIGAFLNIALGMRREFKRPIGGRASDARFSNMFARQAIAGIVAVIALVLIAFGILGQL